MKAKSVTPDFTREGLEDVFTDSRDVPLSWVIKTRDFELTEHKHRKEQHDDQLTNNRQKG